MTILTPQGKQIVPSDRTTAGERRGRRRHSQLINVKGIPRYDDLLTTRFLEQTPTVSLPMNTAKKQARAIPWSIEPTVDNPTATHNMMADRIYEFIDGSFNQNGDTWDQFLSAILNDSISIDTGAVEFVPTEKPVEHPQTGERCYWLSEVYPVDGTIVTKNLDEYDRMPQPPEPAFFKWGNTPNVKADLFDSSMYDRWFDRFRTGRLLSGVRQRAVPMTSDEMAILETNPQPRELSAYGRGVVQQVRPWAEILLNQDQANVRHFSNDEYSKGILNIGEQYAGEIDVFRQYWEDEVRGNTDSKLPKIASNKVEYIPFGETLKELQYLESQNWYSKLVWLLFGESTSTIGLAEDANTATAEAQSEDVLYNTTKPELEALAEWMNKNWLPKMRAYWIADGELEFTFNFDEHPILADRERKKRRDDLNNSLKTPNEIREVEGKDPLPWGDVPSEAVNAFVRNNPEWVMEHWGEVENVPEAQSDDMSGFFSHAPREAESTTETDLKASEAPAASHTGNQSETTSGRHGYDEGETTDFRHTPAPDLKTMLESPETYLKEPLRNERSGELPNLTGIVERGSEALRDVLLESFDQLEPALENRWPEDGERKDVRPETKGLVVDFDAILDGISLRDGLTAAISGVVADAMQEGAEAEATQVAKEIAERIGDEEAEIMAAFDVEDTFAFERMQESAARDMVTVEQTVKERIRRTLLEVAEDGDGLQQATERLRSEIDELSDSHARLVARTETLDASRHGTQALAESSDAIGGKRWRASQDGRTRPWHDAMDDVVVGKQDDFMVPGGFEGPPDYQPSSYPRSAFVVGDDQPFNCRCIQQSVLAEDMPDSVRGMRDFDGIEVRFSDKHEGDAVFQVHYDLSERQFEVREQGRVNDSETFADVWARVRSKKSHSAVVDEFGMSKTTVVKWDKAVGV